VLNLNHTHLLGIEGKVEGNFLPFPSSPSRGKVSSKRSRVKFPLSPLCQKVFFFMKAKCRGGPSVRWEKLPCRGVTRRKKKGGTGQPFSVASSFIEGMAQKEIGKPGASHLSRVSLDISKKRVHPLGRGKKQRGKREIMPVQKGTCLPYE